MSFGAEFGSRYQPKVAPFVLTNVVDMAKQLLHGQLVRALDFNLLVATRDFPLDPQQVELFAEGSLQQPS